MILLHGLISVCLLFASLHGAVQPIVKGTQQEWLMMIDHIESLFLTNYAPLKWKKEHYGWDLRGEAEKARQKILNLNDYSLDNVKPILNTLFYSAQDGHVSITYNDNRVAYIGMSLFYHEGGFYVFKSAIPQIKPGDQLVSFDGLPPEETLSQILNGMNEQLDERMLNLGANLLSNRKGELMALPTKPTADLIVKQEGNLISITLPWEIKVVENTPPEPVSKEKNPYGHYWTSYTINNRRIGYLKITTFADPHLLFLIPTMVEELIDTTDALVIDLQNNPGGQNILGYHTLAWLTPKPLKVWGQLTILDQSKDYGCIKMLFNNHDRNLLDFCNLFYPEKDLRADWRREIEKWSQGITSCMNNRTTITPFRGAYDKPIFVLINSKSSSCAELVPAILQDNQRAMIIGSNSSGLGGAVEVFQPFLPYLGVAEMRLTVSLLSRADASLVEDYGVTPDLPMSPTLQERLNPQLFLKRVFEEGVLPSLPPPGSFRLPAP